MDNKIEKDTRPVIDLKVLIEKLARLYNLDEQEVNDAINKLSKMVEERVNGKA